MRFIVLFQRILTLEIESRFFKSTNECPIEFITIIRGRISDISSCTGRTRFLFEVKKWWWKRGNYRSYMNHIREIEIFERKSEKHLCHLSLYQARSCKSISDFKILIKNIFNSICFSTEDILTIIYHAHENTKNIYFRTRKFVSSSTCSTWRTTERTISLRNICPIFGEFCIISKSKRRIIIPSHQKLCLYITEEILIQICRHLCSISTCDTICHNP